MATADPFPIARFSVEQYHRMIESGALGEDDRVELIDGWVVTQMAKGPEHAYSTGQCQELLQRLLPDGWHLRNQEPITLADSEPEPDLGVVRGARQDYRDRHPGPSDVALVIEVSESSLATDRGKARIYARAGIREYWIVNLVDRSLEVHSEPQPGPDASYARCQVLHAGDRAPFAVAGRELGTIDVTLLLPRGVLLP
jgi:Uma2 family endonuclease